jgi:hypothetical protein
LRWYQATLIALDLVPEILADRWKFHWEKEQGLPWTPEYGYTLAHGGTLPPYTAPLAGTFSVAVEGTVVSADVDVTDSVRAGDRISLDGDVYVVHATSVPPVPGQVGAYGGCSSHLFHHPA